MRLILIFSIQFLYISLINANCDQVCGRKPQPKAALAAGINTKIIAGKQVEANSHAWLAMLTIPDTGDQRSLCAGSLINNRFIVTAAHCFSSKTPSANGIRVYLGLNNQQIDYRYGFVDVKRVIVHQGYDKVSTLNDIALLELVNPVEFTTSVFPICLATAKQTLNFDEELTIAGWGRKSNNPTDKPTNLLETKIMYKKSYECGLGSSGKLFEAIGCAGKLGTGWCKGDSGGAVTMTDNGKAFLFGVISSGPKNCEVGYPRKFMRVSYYFNWIKSNSATGTCESVSKVTTGQSSSNNAGSGRFKW